MTGQGALDFAARRTDPATSHLAAARIKPVAASDRDLVLAILRDHGPLNDFEIAAIAGRQQTSLGVRRHELCVARLVEYAGFTRPSPSGSPSRVWRAIA